MRASKRRRVDSEASGDGTVVRAVGAGGAGGAAKTSAIRGPLAVRGGRRPVSPHQYRLQRDSFGCGPVATHNIMTALNLSSPGLRHLYTHPRMCEGGFTRNSAVAQVIQELHPHVFAKRAETWEDVRRFLREPLIDERASVHRCVLVNMDMGRVTTSGHKLGHFVVLTHERNSTAHAASPKRLTRTSSERTSSNRMTRSAPFVAAVSNMHMCHRYADFCFQWSSCERDTSFYFRCIALSAEPHFVQLFRA